MLVMRSRLCLIILSFIFNSCDLFYSNKHLIGLYYLRHDKFGKAICYKADDNGDYVELINGSFRPIGFDNNYIIVERDQYEYLILPVYKKFTYFPEKGILGPFNLSEFNKQKQKLSIKANFSLNTN
jgi:hypothetical protein